MEALALPPENTRRTISPDSTESNPETVKSEDGNSPNDGGRGSPPPNCAICLGKCRNKSFTDSCLHQFCFKCLLTWSKVKTECPLCKQNFKAIIHNVRSNQQYEEYPVEQPRRTPSIVLRDLDNATRRFRYRTTLTLPRRETLAIQQFLLHYPLSALIDDMAPAAGASERRRSPQDFRRTIYRHNLWARPLPDFTGRFRVCSPEFYRYNESQMHRLLPWLNRELYYLLNENTAHIAYVLSRIVELLPQYSITSAEFREAMRCYFGERTEHFLHELYCFASTPYDLAGYDRNVQYEADSRVSAVVNEVLSSSDSDGSRDSDIVVVSSSHPAAPPPAAGPSRAPRPGHPARADVVPIETISHSDSDSDSSVMVVGYIKPPHQRTPEHVDLVASDSDVVVQEESAAAAPAVKLTLSRPRPAPPSDSEDEAPPARPPRRRPASAASRTPPPRPPRSDDDDYAYPATSTDSATDSTDGERSSDSSSGSPRPRPPSRRKRRTKSSRRRSPRRPSSGASPRRSDTDDGPRSPADAPADAGRRRKSNKSRNGKGVKSSKRAACPESAPPRRSPAPVSASGSHGDRKRRHSSDGGRHSRNGKRLRSVVTALRPRAPSHSSDSDNIPLTEAVRKAHAPRP